MPLQPSMTQKLTNNSTNFVKFLKFLFLRRIEQLLHKSQSNYSFFSSNQIFTFQLIISTSRFTQLCPDTFLQIVLDLAQSLFNVQSYGAKVFVFGLCWLE